VTTSASLTVDASAYRRPELMSNMFLCSVFCLLQVERDSSASLNRNSLISLISQGSDYNNVTIHCSYQTIFCDVPPHFRPSPYSTPFLLPMNLSTIGWRSPLFRSL